MAKSILNVVMQGASGKIGKTLVFRQMRNGETVISNRPKQRSVPLTPGEVAHREKFLEASYLAKRLTKHPVFGPQYLAMAAPGQSAYTVAMADCLSAPQIKAINADDYTGAVGDIITIRAIDNFKVNEVKLRILDAIDNLIEEGAAVLDEHDLDWVYTASVANPSLAGIKIEVTASDIPGNIAVDTVTIV
jgi:hypothetical protein